MNGAQQIAKTGTAITAGAVTTKRAARRAEKQMVKKLTRPYFRRGRRRGWTQAGMVFLMLLGAIAAFFPRTAQRLLEKPALRRQRLMVPDAARRVSQHEPQLGERPPFSPPAYPDDGIPATAEHEVGTVGLS